MATSPGRGGYAATYGFVEEDPSVNLYRRGCGFMLQTLLRQVIMGHLTDVRRSREAPLSIRLVDRQRRATAYLKICDGPSGPYGGDVATSKHSNDITVRGHFEVWQSFSPIITSKYAKIVGLFFRWPLFVLCGRPQRTAKTTQASPENLRVNDSKQSLGLVVQKALLRTWGSPNDPLWLLLRSSTLPSQQCTLSGPGFGPHNLHEISHPLIAPAKYGRSPRTVTEKIPNSRLRLKSFGTAAISGFAPVPCFCRVRLQFYSRVWCSKRYKEDEVLGLEHPNTQHHHAPSIS